jgi:hypothetical protein
MKKYIFTLIIMMYAFTAIAQWETEYNLTGGSSYPSLSRGCMAANGNYINVVWSDSRDGNSEIYYKRSTDSGLNWGADTRLTNDPDLSGSPTVTALGTFVHITWVDFRNGNPEIYYKHSTDYGASWEAVQRLTNDAAASLFPFISASGNDLHIAWVDERNGNKEIYYKLSTNKGVSWGADFRLTQDPLVSDNVSIVSSGSFVHTAWEDTRDGNYEIYYKRSTNGGTSWDAVSRITNSTETSQYASISVTGTAVHIVWVEQLGSNSEIYYIRSVNNGLNWDASIRLTNNSAISEFPAVFSAGLYIHAVWDDFRDGNQEIYYKRSTDGGATWNNSVTRLTNDPEDSKVPSVCVTGSALHVIWSDKRLGSPELFYKRNSTGNPVGITGTTSEIPSEFSLTQNYPNPFNPVTNIRFSVPKSGVVKLTIYDAAGREAAVLFNCRLSAGTYNYDFNASHLASGIYFYRLESGSFTQTKKMILIK